MKKPDEQPPPVIFPGQMEVIVTDDGETDVREVLIPPPPKPTDQLTLGLSEV